jgi:hypothetical protein
MKLTVSSLYQFMRTTNDWTSFADENVYLPQVTDTTGLDTAHTLNTARTGDAANADFATARASDSVDAADVADADLLEEMENNTFSFTNPELDQPVEAQTLTHLTSPIIEPQPPASPPARPTEPNASPSDTSHQVIVKHFPYGRPGAPITGAGEGVSLYHSSLEAFATSVWAPFHSQCDWEIARWAKMRGPSSSAMEELLAIPEVRAH